MSNIEWPEGATHRIESTFVRLVNDEPLDFLSNSKPIEMWDGNEWLKVRIDKDAMIEELKKEPEATKSETEPYKPEVGEWCECSYPVKWSEVYYIGEHSTGGAVIELKTGECLPIGGLVQFRPIKSERDQFIERAMDLCVGCLGSELESIVRTTSGVLHDNGARFTDENS